jgi:curved DNA-binding protein CbpA
MATLGERNLYDVLGAPRDATPEALKHAFRSRASSLDRDVSADSDADARFAEVSQAYEVLSRPAARLLYDRFGYVTPPETGSEESAPGDALEVEDPPPGYALELEDPPPGYALEAEDPPPGYALEVEDPPPVEPRQRTRRRPRARDAAAWRIVDVPPDAAASEPSDVDAEVRERDPRLVRYAAAAGAVAATALLMVLALAPDALAF